MNLNYVVHHKWATRKTKTYRIILKWILRELGWGNMDWTALVHGREQWRALVNMAMNLQVP
jgi:hypothetical protein